MGTIGSLSFGGVREETAAARHLQLVGTEERGGGGYGTWETA